jgi:hypothetical protein
MGYEKEDLDVLQERYADILKKLDYIECDIGWFDIIDKCLADILKVSYETGFDVQVVQIKEKFAGLRIYYDIADDADEDTRRAINDAIDNAEIESYTTCEVCGEEGKVQKKGWWKTLCILHQHNLGK